MVISCRLSCKLGYRLELDVLYCLHSDLCVLDVQGSGSPQTTLICKKYYLKHSKKEEEPEEIKAKVKVT